MLLGLSGTADAGPKAKGPQFVGIIPDQPSRWEYQGLIGIDAGEAMCRSIAASRVCTYGDLVRVEKAGGLPKNANTTFWVHRTEPVTLSGEVSEVGPEINCNYWSYSTAHHNWSGGTGHLNGGRIDFVLGHDPGNPVPLSKCGGESHAILCCK